MKKLAALLCSAALMFLFASYAPALRAQEGAAAASQDEKIKVAAAKLFKALAEGDVSNVALLTSHKYVRHLNPDKLRPPATGPKLKGAFDGNVTVVRSDDDKDAVVEAKVFEPQSSDIPPGEASRVRVYMVSEGGEWKASAADKEEADNDSTLNGGWYHAGFFTFCPNKGLIFVPNHFSREVKCGAIAQCKRF